MGLLDFLKPKKKSDTPPPQQIYIADFEKSLSPVLEIFLQFKDAYLQTGDRIQLTISTSNHDISRYGRNFQLNVRVSDWWDNIMLSQKDIKDQFETVFTHTSEREFQFSEALVATCALHFPTQTIDRQFQEFLNGFENRHEDVRFERMGALAAALTFTA